MYINQVQNNNYRTNSTQFRSRILDVNRNLVTTNFKITSPERLAVVNKLNEIQKLFEEGLNLQARY